MAYNYDDQIPTWSNEGTEPTDSVKLEGFKAGYKPPAAYFNWFWSRTLKWLNDIRTKISGLHTQLQTVETKVATLEDKDYDVAPNDILNKLKEVDGNGSGLDADTLDGKDASYFANVDHTHSQYAATNHNHAVATNNSNGFMSAEDKKKLDAVDLGTMSTYTHPVTHPASMITGLSDVAKSGNYADLINKPVLSAVATSNDYNDLKNKPAQYTHPTTHSAAMIEETTNIKMMTAAERSKLSGIEAQANKYTHPSTHPASMITGLSEYISMLGYSQIAHGSYVGTAEDRGVVLPFSPVAVIIIGETCPISNITWQQSITMVQGSQVSAAYSYSGSTGAMGMHGLYTVVATLTNNTLWLNAGNEDKSYSGNYGSANREGYSYTWIAFGE